MRTKTVKFEYHDNGHCSIFVNDEDLGLIGLIEGSGPFGQLYHHSDKLIPLDIRREALNFIRECEGWCRSDCSCDKCIIREVHES